MAYIQNTNPFAKTMCGRRRAGGIGKGAFKKVNVQALKEVSKQKEN